MEVKASPLKVGDTFLTKDRLLLRIVEEAILYGVRMDIKRDDTFQVNTHGLNGDTFHVHGNFGKRAGWKVRVCVVGIENISRPATPKATAAKKRTSPAGNNNSVTHWWRLEGRRAIRTIPTGMTQMTMVIATRRRQRVSRRNHQ